MATATKTVKVRVLKGTHVLEDGAKPPAKGATQGTLGQVIRPGDEAEIPEAMYEANPLAFKAL